MEREEELIGFDPITRQYVTPEYGTLFPVKVEEIPLTLAEEVWDELPIEDPIVLIIDRSYFPDYGEGDGKEKPDGDEKRQGKEESQSEGNDSPSDGPFEDPDQFDGDGEVFDQEPNQEGGSVETSTSRDLITGEDDFIRVREKDRSWFEL